jgi:hypothetical protein
VDVVRTDVSEERIFIIKVTIGELGATLAVTSNRSMQRRILRLIPTANVRGSPILVTLMIVAIRCSDTSVLTRVTPRHIPEDGILHSHCRENHTFFIALTGWTL